MLEIDRTSSAPLYRQLKDQARLAIETGEWAPGMRLPSERELVAALDVSRITVRQALRELTVEGYLVSAAGRGFFVADQGASQELDGLLSFSAAMRRRGVTPTSQVIEAEVILASAGLARQFGIEAGEEVVALRRLHTGDGMPMTLQQVWLPHRLVPGLIDGVEDLGSLYEQLRGRYGLVLARAESSISGRLADAEEAALLDLGEPPVALIVDQVTTDIHGRTVEISKSLHHPQRLPLSVTQTADRSGGSVRASFRPADSGSMAVGAQQLPAGRPDEEDRA